MTSEEGVAAEGAFPECSNEAAYGPGDKCSGTGWESECVAGDFGQTVKGSATVTLCVKGLESRGHSGLRLSLSLREHRGHFPLRLTPRKLLGPSQ